MLWHTSLLEKGGKSDHHTEKKWQSEDKVENGVILPPSRNTWSHQKPEEARKGFYPESQKAGTLLTLDFGFWSPELGENRVLLFLSHQILITCYSSPKKQTWMMSSKMQAWVPDNLKWPRLPPPTSRMLTRESNKCSSCLNYCVFDCSLLADKLNPNTVTWLLALTSPCLSWSVLLVVVYNTSKVYNKS